MRQIRLLLFLSFLLLGSLSLYGRNSRTIYVSSSLGNDNNTGQSTYDPIKTIEKALTLGDTVLLKANDVFYSQGIVIKGKYLSRYGRGENPIIFGYKRLVAPRWVCVEKNIWKLDLAENNFTGVVLYGSSMSNNIGCIHEYDKDLIHGHKVQYLSELKEDWDIWQTERYDKQMPASDFNTLYLYYTDNPNKKRLEFSVGNSAVNMRESVIDGIDFEGYGFGIAAGTLSVIRNSTIDAIGGKTLIGYETFTNYGNGIEFYVSNNIEDCLVENCIISRCYDCGITIQGSNCKQATPRNIIIRNNLIYDCCQGWEDFLRNDDNVVYENCVFEGNTVLNNGDVTGFGYPEKRFKYCHILGNNVKGNKGMIIRNNTFVGGNFYCSGAYQGEYMSNVWQGNVCVIERGDYILSNYTGSKDVIRIPTEKGEFATLSDATKDAIRRYRELTGDKTTEFVIKGEWRVNRRVSKLKRKYVKNAR